MVHANQDTEKAGRVVRVVDGSTIVRRDLAVTGLQQVLSIHPTLRDAQSV
ncbi:hypothetical protein [Kibdelosporangium phytohabitans]|nr:hypothetical protein [Kibdelosporangium phytohabitans]MBE1470753.1 anti-anti-sigma regulatory factor [Kibdelosporangium phytohabitans]